MNNYKTFRPRLSLPLLPGNDDKSKPAPTAFVRVKTNFLLSHTLSEENKGLCVINLF